MVAAATPSNVVGLFRKFAAGAEELGVAFVDIDSWDCDVAEVIAAELRPRLIVVEVNLNFPPPFRFASRYDEGSAEAVPIRLTHRF